ncbi:unnamed protein product [Schistosoma mattheei]|uniref:Uncharacterized protein n=1 Tax=Schistosoma mattheei TaxID=31246 RepID=A0A183PBH4_9TREM|nr:unnamed protein product [Schistosoma mattheei]
MPSCSRLIIRSLTSGSNISSIDEKPEAPKADFVHRHIGPSEKDINHMLQFCGFNDHQSTLRNKEGGNHDEAIHYYAPNNDSIQQLGYKWNNIPTQSYMGLTRPHHREPVSLNPPDIGATPTDFPIDVTPPTIGEISKIWDEEQVPTDWKEGHLIKITKKRDLSKCDNYRGITLCQYQEMFSTVLLNQMKDSVNAQLRHKATPHLESSRLKEKGKIKEHIMPRNGDRHEKNEQQLDRTRKEDPGQSGLKNVGRWPMPHCGQQAQVSNIYFCK